MEALAEVHACDNCMYHEFASLVAMPSWLLTEVRPVQLLTALTKMSMHVVHALDALDTSNGFALLWQ